MRVVDTTLAGVFVVEVEPIIDDRGMFARTFCADEMAAHGMSARIAQCSVSTNAKRGTVRGMHWQAAPHEEEKLVRCTAGAIWDVALDLRPTSPTYLRWFGVELTAAERRALYVPAGCAHGFQTLVDDAEVLYQISVPYSAPHARGARWDDPAFAISWPLADAPILSPKDRGLADFVVQSERG